MICGSASPNFSWKSSSFNSPWATALNDWGPCIGNDNYNFPTPDTTTGDINGYSYSQASADAFCSPDTTEHQESQGLHANSFTATKLGTVPYTITAVFTLVGTISAEYSSGTINPCDTSKGYAHIDLQLNVGVWDNTLGIGYTQGVTDEIDWNSNMYCSTSGSWSLVPAYITTTVTIPNGDSIITRGAVVEETGASENWNGNYANAGIWYNNNGITAGEFQLEYITAT